MKLAVTAGAAAVLGGLGPAAQAADAFAWTPPDAPAVVRGRQTAARFELLPLTEVSVEVDNAFSVAGTEALAAAERRMAEVPGVRRVIGPAGLLEVAVGANGKATARRMLARGEREADGEAARQRVVRRADALGWFLAANGRVVRFLVDAPDFGAARLGLAEALAASGLALVRPPADGGMDARALWPDPRRRGARWLPAALAAAWVTFMMVAALRIRAIGSGLGRLSSLRAAGVLLAAAVGAAALFLPVRVGGVRAAGARAALVAAGVALLALTIEGQLAPRRYDWHRAGYPPLALALLSLAAVLAAAALSPRLDVGTRQWDEAPHFYVSVRGDMDEPVVLREVRRLTDFLRAQPGVANAWSVADLFAGVGTEGEEASRIPDDADRVRRVLVETRTDPAVRLELSADHREALVGVRFDEEAPADRLELSERLADYLETDLRSSLARVDLRARDLSPVTRAVAQGLLAVDTKARVTQICARSGRSLSAAEEQAVERAARQAALVPAADVGRLRAEIAAEVRARAAHWPFAVYPGEPERLAGELGALPGDAGVADVRTVLAGMFGGRASDAAVAGVAEALQPATSAVRRRHTARINFKEMLYGADLPTEGVLADEVRGATLEGMGPVVGIPVARGSAGVFKIDALGVGGAANDRALSATWDAALPAALAGALAALAVLLFLVGGARGLTWLPVALAPAAMAALPAALLREPLGLWSLSFLGGALAAGAVIAASLAARRQA